MIRLAIIFLFFNIISCDDFDNPPHLVDVFDPRMALPESDPQSYLANGLKPRNHGITPSGDEPQSYFPHGVPAGSPGEVQNPADFSDLKAEPFELYDLEEKLTRSGKWPEFLQKLNEQGQKSDPDKVNPNWEQEVYKWAAYAKHVGEAMVSTTTQRPLLRIAEPKERPSLGLDAYWSGESNNEPRSSPRSMQENSPIGGSEIMSGANMIQQALKKMKFKEDELIADLRNPKPKGPPSGFKHPPDANIPPPNAVSPPEYPSDSPPNYPSNLPPQNFPQNFPPQNFPQNFPPQNFPPPSLPSPDSDYPSGSQNFRPQNLPRQNFPPGSLPQNFPPQNLPRQNFPPRSLPQNFPPQNLPPQNSPPETDYSSDTDYPSNLIPKNFPPQNLTPQNVPPQNSPPQSVQNNDIMRMMLIKIQSLETMIKEQAKTESPKLLPSLIAERPKNLKRENSSSSENEAIKKFPVVDDFNSPIRWVRVTSNETDDGLARVTDPETGTNRQYIVDGIYYVPIIDYRVERVGITTLKTTLAPLLTTEKSILRTVMKNVDAKSPDERDWLAVEVLMGGVDRNEMTCEGDRCQARCRTMGCQSMCEGDGCASGCIGPACTAHCRGPGCLSMCIGERCTSLCDGLSCDSRCRGTNCEANCQKFSCYKTVNGDFSRGGGNFNNWYPQDDG